MKTYVTTVVVLQSAVNAEDAVFELSSALGEIMDAGDFKVTSATLVAEPTESTLVK